MSCFFIYSRKSKFTGKGESVENQVEMCRGYLERQFGDLSGHQIEVFEDEGFSGKNLSRPEFQRMMGLAQKGGCDYIVCYRLDRISRSVSDFSNLIESLSKLSISFICIKEQFDTSTPMGRAMMYIASVFAQLERETIAERIRDNLQLLARTGRWLGGITPLGYESQKVSSNTIDGKEKTLFKLSPIKEEQEQVELIFRLFMDVHSLTKVETYLLQHHIKTRNGKDFNSRAIREILLNPVYCVADYDAYQYFVKQETDLCCESEAFDGKHGIAVYNRTKNDGDRQIKTSVTDWVITVGKHKGFIKSEDWIKVQKLMELNKPRICAKSVKNEISLLSGLLVCKHCGSYLRPLTNTHSQRNSEGNQTFAYKCELKRKSKKQRCDIPNVNGNTLDKMVCEEVLSFDIDGSWMKDKLKSLRQQMNSSNSLAQTQANVLNERLVQIQQDMNTCLNVFATRNVSDDIVAIANEQMKKYLDDKAAVEHRLFELKEEIKISSSFGDQAAILTTALRTFNNTFHRASVHEKRLFLRAIIEKIEWDGKDIHIFLFGESA
ncbi:recombinase family protein [Oscillospiraceae bacterium MB08-C2-2]|nr:recombinase family protein [Oscillospiraceae bacterium MB08-C2-2]